MTKNSYMNVNSHDIILTLQ